MRSVPIQMFIEDKPEPFGDVWHFGVWGRSVKRLRTHGEELWGLAIPSSGTGVFPTHMCYSFEYANPWMGIKRRRQSAEDCLKEGFQAGGTPEEWSRWYFDVGRKLYCTLDELERCLRELNIEENYKET